MNCCEKWVEHNDWPPNAQEFIFLCEKMHAEKNKWDDIPKVPSNINGGDVHIRRIIDEGALICKKLKDIYPDKGWLEIAKIFTKLKSKTRIAYGNYDNLGFLIELNKFNTDSLLDAIHN
jgi:hypothetical protein